MSNAPNPNIAPPVFAEALVDLAACVCEYINVEGQGPVCWCGLYPGAQVQWIECGECSDGRCGMAYVRPGRVFPYGDFPFATADIGCTTPLAYEVEVGVLRCFPTIGDGGDAPDPVEVTEAALGLLLDQWALARAIKCCGSPHIDRVSLDSWNPFGPAGNCVGGSWTIYIDPAI